MDLFDFYDILGILFSILIYSCGYIHGTFMYHLAGKNSKYIILEKDKFNISKKE